MHVIVGEWIQRSLLTRKSKFLKYRTLMCINHPPCTASSSSHVIFVMFFVYLESAELGVLTWTQLEADSYQTNSCLNSIKKDRGYNYDVRIDVPSLPSFQFAQQLIVKVDDSSEVCMAAKNHY